jgi:hypothetical protein
VVEIGGFPRPAGDLSIMMFNEELQGWIDEFQLGSQHQEFN